MNWYSPNDIQKVLRVGRTTAYSLIKEYIESGGEHFRRGKITRVPEEQFTQYLLKKEKP